MNAELKRSENIDQKSTIISTDVPRELPEDKFVSVQRKSSVFQTNKEIEPKLMAMETIRSTSSAKKPNLYPKSANQTNDLTNDCEFKKARQNANSNIRMPSKSLFKSSSMSALSDKNKLLNDKVLSFNEKVSKASRNIDSYNRKQKLF